MARVNISVPDEMKDRMDGLPSINWSAVAQAAFKTEITIAELRQKNMNDQADTLSGIERLRSDRRANDEWEYNHGEALGKDWALREASYAALARVAAMEDEQLPEEGEDAVFELYRQAEGEEDPSPRFVWEWAEEKSLYDGKIVPARRIAGFIAGATEVFQQV